MPTPLCLTALNPSLLSIARSVAVTLVRALAIAAVLLPANACNYASVNVADELAPDAAFAEAYALARCSFHEHCESAYGSVLTPLTSITHEQCVREVLQKLTGPYSEVGPSTLPVDLERAQACLAQLRSSCIQPTQCMGVRHGDGTEGSPCNDRFDCAAHYQCSGSSTTCGVCQRAVTLADGAYYYLGDTPVECGDSSLFAYSLQTCIRQVELEANAPCTVGSDFSVSPPTLAACPRDTSCSDGYCRPIPAKGAPCTSWSDCGFGLTCVEDLCQPHELATTAGMPCSDTTVCDWLLGLTCVGGVCVAPSTNVNGPCSGPEECAAGTYCSSFGQCRAFLPEGAECDVGSDACESGTWCGSRPADAPPRCIGPVDCTP